MADNKDVSRRDLFRIAGTAAAAMPALSVIPSAQDAFAQNAVTPEEPIGAVPAGIIPVEMLYDSISGTVIAMCPNPTGTPLLACGLKGDQRTAFVEMDLRLEHGEMDIVRELNSRG